jgi:hypothetical protein
MVTVKLDYDQYEELLVLVGEKAMEARRDDKHDDAELWDGIVEKFEEAE